MCLDCRPVYPSLVEEATQKARRDTQDLVRRADNLLHKCNGFEDRYREAGVTFHKTEILARFALEHSTDDWADRYAALESAFLLDSYEEIFAPVTNMVERLTDLCTKAQHVPSAANVHQLLSTLKHELLPALNILITDHRTFEANMRRLEEDVHLLDVFNKDGFQVDELGQRCAWFDPVLDILNKKQTVRSRIGEWTFFADWVFGLPEAQRALGVQAEPGGFNPSGYLFEDRLFVYSMQLIWCKDEGPVAYGSQ